MEARPEEVTAEQEALWVLRAQSDDREAIELLLRSVQPALRLYRRPAITRKN